MALAPIAQISTTYEQYPNYWLKGYAQGTTTPISMATDGGGGTLLAKAEISGGGTVPIGFIKTTGDAIFIPYYAEAYDLYLFPTEAEADANDTVNAIQVADDMGFLVNLPNQVGATTVADMVANTALVVGDIVKTDSYANAGDAGDNSYEVVASGTGTADGGSFIDLPNTTPATQAKGLFPQSIVNVRQWGAVGDVSTDDTTAIDAAWDYVKTIFGSNLSNEVAGELTGTLVFPDGDYTYAGTGLTMVTGNLNIKADPNTVRIRLPDGIYFVTATSAISNTNVVGLNFYGGLGAIKYSFIGNNVTGKHKVTDCMFSNYTECAIGNNSEDMPHVRIARCIFRCREGETAFGIALGGFIDGGAIENNDFRKNKVHIKVGDRLSGNFYIKQNQFINTGAQDRLADIWIVPNSTDANGNASGQGSIIADNKFGNEFMAVDDARILAAVELAGTDRLDKQPDLSWNTTSFITGITIKDNSVSGIGSITAPFIDSYIQHCRGWKAHDNTFQGGDYTYLVQFAGDLEEYNDLSWDIRYAVSSNPNVRMMPVSNQPMGIAVDPWMQSGDQRGAYRAFPSCGDDTGFAELLTDKVIDNWTLVGATKAVITDVLGGQNAIELTASSTTGRIVSPVLNAMEIGSIGFAEVDLKLSTTAPIADASIFSTNFTTGLSHFVRKVSLTTEWKRFIIPFVQAQKPGADNFQLQIRVEGYVLTTAERIQIGRPQIYQADQAMTTGHLRTLGTGEWDEEHIIMGNYHIFMNGNDLRLSIGAPTTAADGVLIATAT